MAGRSTPPPAKLSPPRLLRALPRQRLFDWLDAQREGPGIWIGGPPGAGKSTLVASYLVARGLNTIWYRLDRDDNDAGHLFALLAQSPMARPIAAHLPHFSVEHLGNLESYARGFFRALFARLPRPAALVFDNTEQAQLASLPALIGVALDEAPAGITLFITSRTDSMTVLAQPGAAGRLAVLPPDCLAFADDEARAYARTAEIDENATARASKRVGGWAAGLALIGHEVAANSARASGEKLFDYFAACIYAGLTADRRRLLAVASLLPFVPVDIATEVSGMTETGFHLEQLREGNLFTERLDQTAAVYRFHPLFREFLQHRAAKQFSPAEIASFQRHAARAFWARQQHESAIDLYIDAGDFRAAADLLLGILEDKLAAAQIDQVVAWLARFPDDALDAEPRLLYGWARASFLREDARALTLYERAHRRFAVAQDLYWRQLCAAGALEWNYNTDSFLGHGIWCDVFLTELPVERTPLIEQHALRLANGRLLACFFAGDFTAQAATRVREILRLLAPGGAESEKLSTAITLLGCLERHKRWDEATLLAGRMESLLATARVGPRLGILVRQQIAADLYRQTGDYEEMCKRARVTRAEAREHGFAVLEYEGVAILLIAALCMGDEVEARKLLAELGRISDPGNVYHQRLTHQMQAWHALQQHNLAAAREHADLLRAAVQMSDMPVRFRATWLLLCPYVAFAEGNRIAALDELTTLMSDAESGSRETLEANLLTLQAWLHLDGKDETAARDTLARGWNIAAGVRYYQVIAPLRGILARLALFALHNHIAAGIHRGTDLPPPPPTAAGSGRELAMAGARYHPGPLRVDAWSGANCFHRQDTAQAAGPPQAHHRAGRT